MSARKPPPLERFGAAEVTRAVQVGWVLATSVVRGLWSSRGRPRRAGASVADAVVDGFDRLGPTFVKLGQLIASSPGLFPEPLAQSCRRCLDQAAPVDAREIRRVIEADLGIDAGEAFAAFDEEPLSAASVAQVHACTLPDGTSAVIKVQRPGIASQMNVDLRILYRLAQLAARSSYIRRANPVAIIVDLHRVTNEELDFALEAQRQSSFRDNLHAFGDNAAVTTPEVYWPQTGSRVICMQRLHGTPIDHLPARDGQDGQRLLREAVKAWLEAACVHGPFHGDLHAGNLWILDDGRIAFLDFGIMGELSPEWRDLVRDLLRTLMVDRDFERMANALQRMGVIPADAGDHITVGRQLAVIIDPLLASTITSIPLGELLQVALRAAAELGGVAPAELVLLGKQILYVERYLARLAPDWQLAQDTHLVANVLSNGEAGAEVRATSGHTGDGGAPFTGLAPAP